MKNTPLPSREELLRWFHYDEETGFLTWKSCRDRPSNVDARVAGNHAGWINDQGYVEILFKGRHYRAQRIIWMMVTGEDPGDKLIDHADRIRSNNRWVNLRKATPANNTQNSKLRANNTTGFRGVFPAKGRFVARIYVDKKPIYLGSRTTPAEAAQLYDAAATRYFKEFAAHKSPSIGPSAARETCSQEQRCEPSSPA